jgi:single-strand DNA-binding protein
MPEGLNRVQLMGNLGQDPELRHTQGGEAVLNMRLATSETYFDRDRNKKERTEWHTVVVWGKRAEALSKFLKRGSSMFVEGSIRNSSFEGKDGQKRYKTEISARNIILTGGRRDGQADGDYSRGGEAGAAAAPDNSAPLPERKAAPDFGPDDDDIPF